jgi:hypothetical protein
LLFQSQTLMLLLRLHLRKRLLLFQSQKQMLLLFQSQKQMLFQSLDLIH